MDKLHIGAQQTSGDMTDGAALQSDASYPRHATADSESDDEYYESPVDLIKEFGSHPLMERAQKALTAQLKETQQRLQSHLLQKEDNLKHATTERETLGVQLYSLQQQLARVQINLENAHGDCYL